MDAESWSEDDHLERISLLSAGLANEHVAAIVEVTQVGFGGAHQCEVVGIGRRDLGVWD